MVYEQKIPRQLHTESFSTSLSQGQLHMQRKLQGISSVSFDVTGHLITYSAFVKYCQLYKKEFAHWSYVVGLLLYMKRTKCPEQISSTKLNSLLSRNITSGLFYSRDAAFWWTTDTLQFSCQLLGTDHLLVQNVLIKFYQCDWRTLFLRKMLRFKFTTCHIIYVTQQEKRVEHEKLFKLHCKTFNTSALAKDKLSGVPSMTC